MAVAIFTNPEQLHRALLQNIRSFHGVAGILDHRSGSHLHYVDWSRISAANSSEHQLH